MYKRDRVTVFGAVLAVSVLVFAGLRGCESQQETERHRASSVIESSCTAYEKGEPSEHVARDVCGDFSKGARDRAERERNSLKKEHAYRSLQGWWGK